METIPARITDLTPGRPDDLDHDDIILAVDENGIERLRFIMPLGNLELSCRFPNHGAWNDYIDAVAQIVSRFSEGIKEITIPELQAAGNPGLERAKKFIVLRSECIDYWELVAETILMKAIADQIENNFWKYLRPTITLSDGAVLTGDGAREHFRTEADVTTSADFFIAFVNVDDILKKNVTLKMKKGFLPSGKSSLSNSSQKSSDGPKNRFKPRVSYA